MKGRWALRVVKMIAIAIVAVIAIGFFVMTLWNALIPDLFKGPVITYWQAIGLLVLSHILFHGGHHRSHGGWHRDRWSKRLEEKLAAMTPEEREKFKEAWRNRCGWVPEETENRPQQ